MIVFAIPLRAEATTKDWEAVLSRFYQTIQSVFNQTNPDFRCIVACNKKPEMDQSYDFRLEFIELSEMPIPTTWVEMARDKFWKLTVIAVRIRQILEQQPEPEKGIYVMPVDADDLLNCRIAEHCAIQPDEHGFVSRDGYVLKNGNHWVEIYNELHTFCGSCNIIKMYRQDLPEELPVDSSLCHDKETAGILNARYPIRFDHHTLVERYRLAGKPFARLPFRSTIYVIGHGDNISSIYHAAHDSPNVSKRFHPVAFLRSLNVFKKKYVGKKLKQEFGIFNIL